MLISDKYDINNLPKSIWLRGLSDPSWPVIYRGTPLQIITDFARDLDPDAGVDDAMRLALLELEDRGLVINLPEEACPRTRAAFLLAVLLASGVAQPMPQS